MGMKDAQTGDPLSQVVSMTLGVDTVTPLMMATAYATFAARGKYCTPVLVTSVVGNEQQADQDPRAELQAGARRRRSRTASTTSCSR